MHCAGVIVDCFLSGTFFRAVVFLGDVISAERFFCAVISVRVGAEVEEEEVEAEEEEVRVGGSDAVLSSIADATDCFFFASVALLRAAMLESSSVCSANRRDTFCFSLYERKGGGTKGETKRERERVCVSVSVR